MNNATLPFIGYTLPQMYFSLFLIFRYDFKCFSFKNINAFPPPLSHKRCIETFTFNMISDTIYFRLFYFSSCFFSFFVLSLQPSSELSN